MFSLDSESKAMNELYQNSPIFNLQVLLSIGSAVLVWIIRMITNRIIKRYARRFGYEVTRAAYTKKIVSVILIILNLTLIAIIWEISIKNLSVYFVSIFTVTGLALFASWSILSNMTASLVLFFNYPFKIGDTILIRDGENSAQGKVIDINLFNIRIKTKDGHEIAYPNNLALQKPIEKIEAKDYLQLK